MGKLIFYYGVMGCSKSANALMTKFQYEERGIYVWLIKPSIDTRSDNGIHVTTIDTKTNTIIKTDSADQSAAQQPRPADEDKYSTKRISLVKSRVGIRSFATNVYPDDDLKKLFIKYRAEYRQNVIICDEAQFFTSNQIEQLRDIAELYDISVLCYGLRTDFKSNLFPGSKRLFELADKVYELESVCDCGRHAIINARIDKAGRVQVSGAQIDIGGDEKYKPMCWRCWKQNQL